MREWAHGIEDVRGVGRSGVDGGQGLFVVCVSVADRYHQARLAGSSDQFQRAGQFRGERQDLRRAARFLQKREPGRLPRAAESILPDARLAVPG